MISKTNRFHGRKSLDYIYRKGNTVRTEFLSLKFAPTRRQDYRLAVVVSRKVSKSAVVRNRIRRRIYETVRLYRRDSGQPIKNDIVISVFDERVSGQSPDNLKKIISDLLSKARR